MIALQECPLVSNLPSHQPAGQRAGKGVLLGETKLAPAKKHTERAEEGASLDELLGFEGNAARLGGDDVLAALPLNTALVCAAALRKEFSSFDALGSCATASAGLVLAHEMENLRYVLASARKAEKQSKDAGRDSLTLAVLRRNGEHSFATCRWEYVPTMANACETFRSGSSDRWTYQLRRQLPVLEGLPENAFRAELRRLLAHSEKRAMAFLDHLDLFVKLHGPVFQDFVTLCQSASFITRGKD
jgi:hypothetical protein